MKKAITICALVIGGFPACVQQDALVPTSVRTIEISDAVTPQTIYARTGEEIRWQNHRSNPVRLGFLSKRLLHNLGCRKGLSSFLGEVDDLVTINPGDSVGICPLSAGELQYNVWFDPENRYGQISPTGTVHVEKGG